MKIAVLDDYQRVAREHADWRRIDQTCELTFFHDHIAADEAARVLAPFQIVCHMRERMPFPADLIDALPHLQMLAVTGPSHRTLDVDAATRRGIAVCHTDGRPGLIHPAPELAWGLVLAVARHIPAEASAMAAGGWQTTLGDTLFGKTLGLLGLGHTGRCMATYARAFGMRTIAWSQNLTPAMAAEADAEWVSKEELFERADVVSIHLVLSARTRAIVAAPELRLMKRGAILINTSRGGVIEQGDVLAALRARHIRAGLDVFEDEPLPADHPIRTAPGAVLTPHIGYVTKETYRAFYEDTVENLQAWLDGAPIRVLNPDALAGR